MKMNSRSFSLLYPLLILPKDRNINKEIVCSIRITWSYLPSVLPAASNSEDIGIAAALSISARPHAGYRPAATG